MTLKTILFMLGITTEYGINVFQVMAALWFLSVGYLLYKKGNRAFKQQRAMDAVDVAHRELPCLSAESYRTGI